MKFNKLYVGIILTLLCFVVGMFHSEISELIKGYIFEHGILMFVSQVVITLVGVPAIYLSQSLNKDTRRWSSVFGLGGQPFWFMMAYSASAWGVFLMSCLYTHAWFTGFKNNWLNTAVDKETPKEEHTLSSLWITPETLLEKQTLVENTLPQLATNQLLDLKCHIDMVLAQRSVVADEMSSLRDRHLAIVKNLLPLLENNQLQRVKLDSDSIMSSRTGDAH